MNNVHRDRRTGRLIVLTPEMIQLGQQRLAAEQEQREAAGYDTNKAEPFDRPVSCEFVPNKRRVLRKAI